MSLGKESRAQTLQNGMSTTVLPGGVRRGGVPSSYFWVNVPESPPGLQDPPLWPPAKTVPGPPREVEPCLFLVSVQTSTGAGLHGLTGHAIVIAFGGRVQKCLFRSWDCVQLRYLSSSYRIVEVLYVF